MQTQEYHLLPLLLLLPQLQLPPPLLLLLFLFYALSTVNSLCIPPCPEDSASSRADHVVRG